MFKYSLSIITVFTLIAIGCSSQMLPGTGGTTNPARIEQDVHPTIPNGVSCYVCHKEDIPQHEFHASYGNKCESCHGTSTWTAHDYHHPAWHLDENHRTRCTRCHSLAAGYDYSQYQCWSCHEQKAMNELHSKINIDEIENCIACHKSKQ